MPKSQNFRQRKEEEKEEEEKKVTYRVSLREQKIISFIVVYIIQSRDM